MRTNIVIDPALLEAAMKAGPYKTKKEAVEAGLKLLARQAAYREVLTWRGKLTSWEGDPWDDLAQVPATSVTASTLAAPVSPEPLTAQESTPGAARAGR